MGRCVIVGAGISGLALAYQLRNRGIEPLVFERAKRPGGVIRSYREDGFLCEAGPASFVGNDPVVAALLGALDLRQRLLDALPAASRRAVVAGGHVLRLPRTPLELATSSLLPAFAKMRLLADLVLPRGPAARGGDESVAAFARRRLGACAGERLLYPLLSALYFADPERLSVGDAFAPLARLECEHRSLLASLLRGAMAAPGHDLVTLPDGVEELPAALAARLRGSLELGAEIRRIARGADGGFRVSVAQGARSAELACDAVVVATPAPVAATLLDSLDGALAARLRSIPYAPLALVHLGYDGSALARTPRSYGFLVPPGEGSWLCGALFPSWLFPWRAPPGDVLVTARMGGPLKPDLAALPETALAQIAQGELARLLDLRARPRFVRVDRLGPALPLYELGHSARVAAIDAAAERYPGLFLTGNAYRGLSIPECIRAASPLAQRIAGYLARRVRAAMRSGLTITGRR